MTHLSAPWDTYPKAIMQIPPARLQLAREATEKVIAELSCPWCSAEPGQTCHDDRRELPNRQVHIARMPTDKTPEEFLAT